MPAGLDMSLDQITTHRRTTSNRPNRHLGVRSNSVRITPYSISHSQVLHFSILFSVFVFGFDQNEWLNWFMKMQMLEREALRRSNVDDVPQEMVLDQPHQKPITKLYLSNLDDRVSNEDIHVLHWLLLFLLFIYHQHLCCNIVICYKYWHTHTETDTSTQLKILKNDSVSCWTLDTSFIRSVGATKAICFSLYICHFGCSCCCNINVIVICVAHTLLIEGESNVWHVSPTDMTMTRDYIFFYFCSDRCDYIELCYFFKLSVSTRQCPCCVWCPCIIDCYCNIVVIMREGSKRPYE